MNKNLLLLDYTLSTNVFSIYIYLYRNRITARHSITETNTISYEIEPARAGFSAAPLPL